MVQESSFVEEAKASCLAFQSFALSFVFEVAGDWIGLG